MYEKMEKRRRPVNGRNIRIGILLILALVMAGILIQRLFVLQNIRGRRLPGQFCTFDQEDAHDPIRTDISRT